LAVKPLSPREHAGRRVGKGGTLGSVQTERHPIPVVAAALRAESLSLHVQASGAGSISSFRNRIIITTHSLQR